MNHQGNLIIRDAKKEDSGDYICEGRNQYGTDESYIAVSVIKETEIVSSSQNEMFKSGNDVNFDCEIKVWQSVCY